MIKVVLSLWLLIPLPLLAREMRGNVPCPCDHPRPDVPFIRDIAHITRSHSLHCCWASSSDLVNLTWTLNGRALEDMHSTFEARWCGPETIRSDFVLPTDKGNYTCSIHLQNGSVFQKTVRLGVIKSPYNGPPRAAHISGGQLALRGDAVQIECVVYVGENVPMISEKTLAWLKLLDKGAEVFADTLPGVHITSEFVDGMISSTLKIDEVMKVHYGNYSCLVRNLNSFLKLNVTLDHGMSELVWENGVVRASLIVILMCVSFLLTLGCLWHRFRVPITLYCRSKRRIDDGDGKYMYDVFIIHGESSTTWVWTNLVARLEEMGYRCFMRDRDLEGGECLLDALCEKINRSRRIIMVMTPCLLESPWQKWALHQAIHTALKATARIVSVVLKKPTATPSRTPSSSTSTSNCHKSDEILLTSIKVLRTLQYPLQVDLDEGDLSLKKEEDLREMKVEEDENESIKQLEETNGSPLVSSSDGRRGRLGLTLDLQPSFQSTSGESQYISNMISGSNSSLRRPAALCGDEDVAKMNEKNKAMSEVSRREATDKTERVTNGASFSGGRTSDHLEEPVSPCSMTPFILPCNANRRRPQMAPGRLKSWLHFLFCGNPEEEFWQKLLIELPPPPPSSSSPNGEERRRKNKKRSASPRKIGCK